MIAPRPAPGLAARSADALLAAAAHAAIAFGFLGIGFLLSLAIDGGIWLYSRRSPYVAFHARQACWYHLFVLLFNIAYLVMLLALLALEMVYPQWHWIDPLTVVLIILGVLWFVSSILYGLWAAVCVFLGRPFAYPVLGRLAAKSSTLPVRNGR